MSLLCFCVIENYKRSNDPLLDKEVRSISERYNRGIKFGVDWAEPIASSIENHSLIISINDTPESDNCELFLLPDGWHFNLQTNAIPFRERMTFLKDLASVLVSRGYHIHLYIAESGTDLNDYINVSLRYEELIDYLSQTIGKDGVRDGIHVDIIS